MRRRRLITHTHKPNTDTEQDKEINKPQVTGMTQEHEAGDQNRE